MPDRSPPTRPSAARTAKQETLDDAAPGDTSGPGGHPAGARAANPSVATQVAGRATALLATALVVADGLLLLANVVHVQRGEPDGGVREFFAGQSWNGGLDGSHIEMFGHIQLVVAVVALLAVWGRRRTPVHAMWAVVLTAVLADDFLMLHERFSGPLFTAFHPPVVAGLRPTDLGELSAWTIAVAALAPVLLLTHLRARGAARRDSWVLAALMAALALFAVVVDMLDIALQPHVSASVTTGLALVETAGELLVMTAIAVAAYRMALRLD